MRSVELAERPSRRSTPQPETWPVYNPIGFDPDEILPENLRRHGDFVRYFLGKLHWDRVFDRRHRDSMIEVKADYIRKLLPSTDYWKPVKKALLDEKVLTSDNHFIESKNGEPGKCIGFRLGPKYAALPQKRVLLTDKFLIKKLRKRREASVSRLDVHRHLQGCLGSLSIDYESAVEFLFEKTRDDEEGSEAFALNESAIRMIRDGDHYFVPCDYGRVHTNVTSLMTELRQFLRYDGLPLVNLDIRNSQPLFLGMLLSNYFQNDKNLANINRYSISDQSVYSESFFSSPIPSSIISPTPPIRCNFLHLEIKGAEGLEERRVPDDLNQYVELCQNGTFYDYMMEKGNIVHQDRRQFKTRFFASVFFCKNNPVRREAEVFGSIFPSVYEAVRELKARDYTQLSKLLQRVESSFMINRVVRALMNEYPDLPLFTIHDSLMTTQEHSETVRWAMMDQFRRVGLAPTINIESY